MDSRESIRDTVLRLCIRDLTAMQREVAAYPDDASLWKVAPGIANSGGTLALHLVGNLRHFIGAVLGGTGYVRERDAEFGTRGLSRDVVVAELATALGDITRTLRSLDPAKLSAPFPQAFGELRAGTDVFLMHLVAHLAYHLGQTDYHRRLITGDGTTVQTMGIPGLLAPLPDVASI